MVVVLHEKRIKKNTRRRKCKRKGHRAEPRLGFCRCDVLLRPYRRFPNWQGVIYHGDTEARRRRLTVRRFTQMNTDSKAAGKPNPGEMADAGTKVALNGSGRVKWYLLLGRLFFGAAAGTGQQLRLQISQYHMPPRFPPRSGSTPGFHLAFRQAALISGRRTPAPSKPF